jgi:Protein of unknown function (DUF3592)
VPRLKRKHSTDRTSAGEEVWGDLASVRAVGITSIVLTIAIGVGAVVIAFMMRAQDERYSALVPRLRSVGGRVEAGSIEHGTRGFKRNVQSYQRAIVRYTYEVEGRTFRSSHQTLNEQPEFSTVAEANAFLAGFPPGAGVQVYYNPDNPAESALEPRFGSMAGYVWGAGIIGLGLVAAALLVAVRTRREMRERPLAPAERRKTLRVAGGAAAIATLAATGILTWDAWDRWSHARRVPHLRQAPGRLGVLVAYDDRVDVTYTYNVPGSPGGSRRGEQWRFGRQTVDDPAEAEAFKKQREGRFAIDVWYDERSPECSALDSAYVAHLTAWEQAALLAVAAVFAALTWAARRALRRITRPSA